MAFNTDPELETYKSLISISLEFLRALLLLNGGAVVALLAYLGQARNGLEVAGRVKDGLGLTAALSFRRKL